MLVIKYRRKVINQDIFDFFDGLYFQIFGSKYGVDIMESNWEFDHVHVLF